MPLADGAPFSQRTAVCIKGPSKRDVREEHNRTDVLVRSKLLHKVDGSSCYCRPVVIRIPSVCADDIFFDQGDCIDEQNSMVANSSLVIPWSKVRSVPPCGFKRKGNIFSEPGGPKDYRNALSMEYSRRTQGHGSQEEKMSAWTSPLA
jgi:hypothetical protein